MQTCSLGAHHRAASAFGGASQQELEQRLLGVEAVLGLVPDGGAVAVEDALGDLLSRVGRQAVKDDSASAAAASRSSSI